MNSSDTSDIEMTSDVSEDSKNNSDDSLREASDDSSDSEYESIVGSDNEFGPEGTQERTPNKDDGLATDKLSLAWVSTFKERVGELISRLLSDSLKFCVSGKMNAPPITSISLLKVRDDDS